MLNAPKDDFDYVVAFHIVMEYIHQQITGIDYLSNIGKLYKLKLSTTSEAISMTSFETSEPLFLTSSGAHHSVVNSDLSYFFHISSFSQLNELLKRFNKRWKQELTIFRSSHDEIFQTHLGPVSPIYGLALSSITEYVV